MHRQSICMLTTAVALALGFVSAHDSACADPLGFATLQAADEAASASPQDAASDSERSEPRPAHLRRQVVAYQTAEAKGTIIIDTSHTYLYYVLGQGRAVRYGIGVGREGFTWAGTQIVARKQEWPDWYPPQEMIERQPYLPRMMSGGLGNPLGARAIYLGGTVYRIHGTNAPDTIGTRVSSGCIRLLNEDITDLYDRVTIGTKIVVLPLSSRPDAELAHRNERAPVHLQAVIRNSSSAHGLY